MQIRQQAISRGLVQLPQALLLSLRNHLEIWATVVVVLAAASFMLSRGTGFSITLMTVFAIWAMLAVSLNLVLGYTGLLSVGHVGFYGIGAYTVAVLTANPRQELLEGEIIQIFAWPFFCRVARSSGTVRGGRFCCWSSVQPVPGRCICTRFIRLRHHCIQRFC